MSDDDDLPDSVAEHINKALDDREWTERIVAAAHIGLSLMIEADTAHPMGLAERLKLYDDASVILGSAVAGKDAMDDVLGSAVIEALKALYQQERVDLEDQGRNN